MSAWFLSLESYLSLCKESRSSQRTSAETRLCAELPGQLGLFPLQHEPFWLCHKRLRRVAAEPRAPGWLWTGRSPASQLDGTDSPAVWIQMGHIPCYLPGGGVLQKTWSSPENAAVL